MDMEIEMAPKFNLINSKDRYDYACKFRFIIPLPYEYGGWAYIQVLGNKSVVSHYDLNQVKASGFSSIYN